MKNRYEPYRYGIEIGENIVTVNMKSPAKEFTPKEKDTKKYLVQDISGSSPKIVFNVEQISYDSRITKNTCAHSFNEVKIMDKAETLCKQNNKVHLNSFEHNNQSYKVYVFSENMDILELSKITEIIESIKVIEK